MDAAVSSISGLTRDRHIMLSILIDYDVGSILFKLRLRPNQL